MGSEVAIVCIIFNVVLGPCIKFIHVLFCPTIDSTQRYECKLPTEQVIIPHCLEDTLVLISTSVPQPIVWQTQPFRTTFICTEISALSIFNSHSIVS